MTAAPSQKPVRVAIVVGGSVGGDKRREVAEHKRPRIDVLEMANRWDAEVYDFWEFHEAAKSNGRSRFLLWAARKTGLWSVMLVLAALPRLREAGIIYATGEDVGFPLGVLLNAFKLTRPRLFVRLEQPTYGRTPARQFLFNCYMRLALRRVTMTICRTTSHLQYLASLHGVPLAALTFTPETTDPAFYQPPTGGPDSRDVPADGPLIVSAGMEMRDYETLIRAVEGLPVRLVIGAGSPWSHFRWDAGESALPANVRVSSFSPAEMRALYDEARFVVVPVKPTLRACGMNVVLEAWASAKAVIVTRTAGQMDYAVDGGNALFVKPGDAGDMRGKIMRLLEDPTEAQRLGRNGRRAVEEKFNLDSFVDAVGGVLFSPVPAEAIWDRGAAPLPIRAAVAGSGD